MPAGVMTATVTPIRPDLTPADERRPDLFAPIERHPDETPQPKALDHIAAIKRQLDGGELELHGRRHTRNGLRNLTRSARRHDAKCEATP
jgi:hypothetical protein